MLTYRYVYYVLCTTPGLFLAYALYDLSQQDMTTRAWTAGATIVMVLFYSLFIAAVGVPLVLVSWRKKLGVRGPLIAVAVSLAGWWYLFFKAATTERTQPDASDAPTRPKPTAPAATALPVTPDVDQPAAVAE